MGAFGFREDYEGETVMTETAVQEKPILFSGAMVRAILEGRKTQTRRVIKPMRRFEHNNILKVGLPYAADPWAVWWHGAETDRVGCLLECPYGKPGTHLWVRETFNVGWLDGGKVLYRADGGSAKKAGYPAEPVYKPSIHIPRWASRITLEIVSVKVERVQDISEADATAEGVLLAKNGLSPQESFIQLWDSINETRDDGKYAWMKNPWVWAIEFKRMEGKR